MTHASASSYCVWSVLSTALGAFLLGHLWRFDRFKCLKWSNSPYSGAFKRVMTYTYLITIPLIMIYSFGFAYIKYHEGFLDVQGSIMVKPYTFWDAKYRRAIFPLMLVFSFAWSFEMITHLEELCFWLFLVNAGPQQPEWFKSKFFRLWMAGSVGAFIYVPAVTIAYRHNPLSCEARTFTAGSVGDLALTLAFIPILWAFPGFLRKVKAEGVDASIIIRLRKFYELNVIRIIFRFLMQIPLLALGADGLRPHAHLNESMFWTDLMSIVAGLGCAFSSVCTLLIFFPRSYDAEYQANEASQRLSTHTHSSQQTSHFRQDRSNTSHTQTQGHTAAARRITASVGERSRRLLRLPTRRHTAPGSSDALLPETRRTMPTARAGTAPAPGLAKGAAAQADAEADALKPGKDRDTYLLTDSPVLRARALGRAAGAGYGEDIDPFGLDDADVLAGVQGGGGGGGGGGHPLSACAVPPMSPPMSPPPTMSPAPAYYPPAETGEYDPWTDDADADGKQTVEEEEEGEGGGGRHVVVLLPEMHYAQAAAVHAHAHARPTSVHGGSDVLSGGARGGRSHAGGGVGVGVGVAGADAGPLTAANVQRHNVRTSQINPLVHNFTSPIDFIGRRPRQLPPLPRHSQPGWDV